MLHFKSPPLALCAIAAVLLLSACEEIPTINESPRLLSPQSTYTLDIRGASDLRNLELRVDGTAVRAVLEDSGDQAIVVTALEEGTASIEVLLDSHRIGVVEFTVHEVNRVVATAWESESWSNGPAPRNVDELRFVTAGPDAANAIFSVQALDAEGRVFDSAWEIAGEIESDDLSTVIVLQDVWSGGQTAFALDFLTVGSHTVVLLGAAGEVEFAFEAISPADVVSLQLTRDESGQIYDAHGLTAEGTPVVNLNPEFSVGGEKRETNGVAYHILIDRSRPRDGTVEATWNGLTATR